MLYVAFFYSPTHQSKWFWSVTMNNILMCKNLTKGTSEAVRSITKYNIQSIKYEGWVLINAKYEMNSHCLLRIAFLDNRFHAKLGLHV